MLEGAEKKGREERRRKGGRKGGRERGEEGEGGRGKEGEEGREEGGGAAVAEGRASLDFPRDGQDDTSLGGEGGGEVDYKGRGDTGMAGWVGWGGLGPPVRQGRDDAQLLC
jgi:hypothetical protein